MGKIKKNLFVFIVASISLFSCHEDKEGVKQDKITLGEHTLYINLPEHYTEFNLEKVRKELSELSEDSLAEILIKQLNFHSSEMKVFVDTSETNFFSYMIFKEGLKIRLNSDNSDVLKKAIRNGIYQKSDFYGKFSLMDLTEEKISAGNYPYLKIKHKIKAADIVFYQTDYFVNSETSTLMVSISNKTGQDFEKNIKFLTFASK